MEEPVSFLAVNVTSEAAPTLIPLDRLAKVIFLVSEAESSTMTSTSSLATEVNSVRSVILLFAISVLDVFLKLFFVGHQYLIP